jgi:hypothetical protein
MKDRKTIFEEFQKMGTKHYFELNNGDHCEGWILEVRDDHILYDTAPGPMADSHEVEIPFEVIDFTSLGYWDEVSGYAVDVFWDDKLGTWKHAKYDEHYRAFKKRRRRKTAR